MSDVLQALVAIATFPITDPKNQDAVNMRQMAVDAVENALDSLLGKDRNTPFSESSMEYRVVKILTECLGVEYRQVIPTANIIHDLGADTLDLVEIYMAVEDEFNIEFPDEEIEKVKTVQDIFDFLKGKV